MIRHTILRDLGSIAVSLGLLSLGTGAIDRATERVPFGETLLIVGTGLTLLGALAVIIGTRRVRLGPGLVLAGGIAPFAAFAIFIAWRIGVSAEQAAQCEEGVAEQCLALGERRLARSKYADAWDLFSTGCELGNAESCLHQASMPGVSDADHRTLLHRSCELESAIACHRLASVSGASERAALIGRSCDLGFRAACAELPTEDE